MWFGIPISTRALNLSFAGSIGTISSNITRQSVGGLLCITGYGGVDSSARKQ
jgi:hypothetical protein